MFQKLIAAAFKSSEPLHRRRLNGRVGGAPSLHRVYRLSDYGSAVSGNPGNARFFIYFMFFRIVKGELVLDAWYINNFKKLYITQLCIYIHPHKHTHYNCLQLILS